MVNDDEYDNFLQKRGQEQPHRNESLKMQTTPVSYFELYKFSTWPERVLLCCGVIFCFISGTAEGAFFIVYGQSIGTIVIYSTELANSASNATSRAVIEEEFMGQINNFGIISGALLAVNLTFFYITNFLFNYTAMKQSFRIRELYFSKVIYQDIPWHDQNSTGDFASRVADDLKKIEDGINNKIAMVLCFLGTIAACAVPALAYGWKLTLVGFASFPVFFIVAHYAGKFTTQLTQNETENFGEAGKIANETFGYIKTVVAFNGQKIESRRYNTVLENVMHSNIRKGFYDALMQGLTNFFIYFSIAILLWYGVQLVTGNQENGQSYNLITMTVVFNGVTVAFFYIGNMTPFFQVFTTAKGAAEKVFSIIKTKSVINKFHDDGIDITNMKGEITFSDVNFSYPARREVPILKNFNLSIKPGETIALVGGSGCGKSTIVQLILRFYDPTGGQILIDGNKIKTVNVGSLRSHIGMVGQEPVLFDGTIAENIKMGKLGASQIEIEEAAKKANAHKFICSFPDGYQTQIGESGAQLSGGQKQRIAIARALVRKPTILLLDEATSALDSHSEAVVQATLEKVSQDCTTLIVAHRLSTVRKADRIVVLENGGIVESGSHDDLMSAQGVYYNLVKMQTSESDLVESRNILDEEIESSSKPLAEKTLIKQKDAPAKTKIDLSSVWCILKDNLDTKWSLTFGLVASVVNAVGTMWYSFLIANALTKFTEEDSDFMISQINQYGIYIFFCGLLLIAAGRFFQLYLIGMTGEHLVKTLRSVMYTTTIKREIGWFEKSENGVGSLGAQLSGEPANVQMAVVMFAATLTNVTMVLIALCIGFYLCWKLSLAYLLFFPVMFTLFYLEHNLLVKENQKNQEVLELSTKLAVQVINNVRTVASLSVEKFFLDLYISKLKTYQSVTIRNILIHGFVTTISKSSFTIFYFITVFLGSRLIIAQEIDGFLVVGISQIFNVSMFTFMATVLFFPNLIGGLASCSRIYDFLSPSNTAPVFRDKRDDGEIGGDIEYKSVSFTYPTRPDVKILNGLDLFVLKGKTVALVGPSGCGKSTIVQLLERFYQPDLGKIVFGKADITGVEVEKLRFRFGIVMQEPNLFSRSIADNIAYGNNEAAVSKDEIYRAAQKANIHNFIVSLPLGYETVLGDRGTQLSGGQKQRIAIARALVRDPEVLLLDEATSALDSESEKIVQEALNNAKEARTCIVIAHRLKTIVDSDLIAVIDKGKVAEKGTHRELMSQKGLYWELYNKQHNSNY